MARVWGARGVGHKVNGPLLEGPGGVPVFASCLHKENLGGRGSHLAPAVRVGPTPPHGAWVAFRGHRVFWDRVRTRHPPTNPV